MGSFRFLDEIALADCAVDVSARNLSDVFETAARALAEVTVDPATVPASTVRTVALEASSLDLLLFDWLSELIYLKDRDASMCAPTSR
jgi:SHS2 domain-containing protein